MAEIDILVDVRFIEIDQRMLLISSPIQPRADLVDEALTPLGISASPLGASSFIYAEATGSQALADWIGAHVNALNAIGGVPRQIVSDNLKAGITKACFYEPTVNRTYADMAAHYRTAIIPARPYKPRDKAKVEVGVQVVQRWILARLRNRRFFSLAEVNRPRLLCQLTEIGLVHESQRSPIRAKQRREP